MADPLGSEFTGQRLARDFWVMCDVCGQPWPHGQTTRRVPSLQQKGLRVCPRCIDAPGVDDFLKAATDKLRSAGRADSEVPEP